MDKEFAKAKWAVDDNQVHLGMEFSKVDKKRRIVAGWATVDNVDTENDQVTAEASLDAFARSRMNLREMHKKDSAVGRIVSFKQDTFRAPTGELHKGIFVKVRVSEGAEDTWKKVLDGTLQGFSIGGEIVDAEETFAKDGSTKVKKVTKYNLNELSLVDNPGNQYSDITSIFKIRNSADGSVTSVTGMVEDHKVLNVLYCDADGISKEVPEDSYECPVCGSEMEYIGVVEDNSELDTHVSTMITKFTSSEGGANMTKAKKNEDANLETVDTGHAPDDELEIPTPANTDTVGEETPAPATETVDEPTDEGNEISKKIDGLKDDIKTILKDNNLETAGKIEQIEKSVRETRDFLDTKVSELDEKIAKFDQNLETTKSRLNNFEKLLNKVNSGTALRKSADSLTDDSEEPQENSSWNGAFSVRNLIG